MIPSIPELRRSAKALKKSCIAGEAAAVARVKAVLPDAREVKYADALHVLAREAGFLSWPKLKLSVETAALDRSQKQELLKIALFHGQNARVAHLLDETPDLARGLLGLEIAVYDLAAVKAALARDPKAAVTPRGPRRPILHLAFSRYIHLRPDLATDVLEIAELLVEHGADVNDVYLQDADPNMPLSALYGALGHANNMGLARWLLDHGANPNDGESLYHSVELGHHEGLSMLLDHGATPAGTNALPRALDFNDHKAVEMLLVAGADPNEGIGPHPSGEPSFVIPCLHQAARRMCDAAMIRLLLKAGADPSHRNQGVTPYAMARGYGNADAARLIEQAQGDTMLSNGEALLAAAADGDVPAGRFVDPLKLPEEFRNLIRNLVHLPTALPHIARLVAIGLEYDRPDAIGLPPVHVAGWEGLPETLAYVLALKPDLGHVNGYGGTLLSTIIHGSENCPTRSTRDHIGCARLVLEEGVSLPSDAIRLAGEPNMAAFLSEWGGRYPGQVVDCKVAARPE